MDSEAVLSTLFSYAGRGHFLYVAGVARSWRTHYTTKTKEGGGRLVTTWHDAVATVETLKYAYENGLEFPGEHKFYPQKSDFGPGVYEYARNHLGLPLIVWVAWETSDYIDAPNGGSVEGVFSSVIEAKQRLEPTVFVAGESDSDTENATYEEEHIWKKAGHGFELKEEDCGDGSTCSTVQPFVVERVTYADEVNTSKRLRMYVTAGIDSFYAICEEECGMDSGFHIEGVYPSRKLADRAVKNANAEYAADYSHGHGFQYSVEWEGYLDGKGGSAGHFFKKRKPSQAVQQP